ncbi:MAG: antitoxin Xre/MbcA/ParS toxin-binding domain-containing protein [Xenococcaceae cyanobacterium]
MSSETPTINQPDTELIQDGITRRDQLIEQLAELLGGLQNADIWMNSPHPVLGGRTPQSYVEEGDLEVLKYFIHAIETGQPS